MPPRDNPSAPSAAAQTKGRRPRQASSTQTEHKRNAAIPLPWARHVVCFWKQNDLGLFGRRPDRWIEYWRQHPGVETVLVFEPPMSQPQLQEMLRLATTLDQTSASEYQLLLQQATRKLVGQCNDDKVRYCCYLPSEGQAGAGRDYLSWVLAQTRQAGIDAPLVVLWPACFANEALVQKLAPSHILVDLVDDQRLFPGNQGQRQAITDQYQSFIRLGQQVVSNSSGLIESFSQEFERPIEHLPNALLPMLPLNSTATDRLLTARDKARPVVGYVGNLRGRIDVDTLTDVMRHHPEWDFWFVGQTHRSAFYQATQSLPNARFWGALSHDRAHAIMNQFDVAIVPFVADSLVKSMSPIKLDDYHRSERTTVVLDPENKKGFERALLEALKKRRMV